jgi:hypothetical protein
LTTLIVHPLYEEEEVTADYYGRVAALASASENIVASVSCASTPASTKI